MCVAAAFSEHELNNTHTHTIFIIYKLMHYISTNLHENHKFLGEEVRCILGDCAQFISLNEFEAIR